MGLPDGHVDGLVDRLSRSGLLDDATGGGPAADDLRAKPGVLDRLRPDAATLSLIAPEPGDAMKRLAARRSLRVQVRGAGRVGAVLASLLSGAGIGEVEVRDVGRVEPGDVSPGGLAGRVDRRAQGHGGTPSRSPRGARPPAPAPPRPPAACGPVRGPAAGPPPRGVRVLAGDPRPTHRCRRPRPQARCRRAAHRVGHTTPLCRCGGGHRCGRPLVLPGETGCAGCLDHSRADRDETWPRLVAQWRSGRPHQLEACDLALATTVAGLAAGHALAFLDGQTPSSAGARWEVSVPGFDWHPRPVWPHPACACSAAEKDAAGKGNGEHTAKDGEAHETMAGHQRSTRLSRKAHAARPAGTWRAHV